MSITKKEKLETLNVHELRGVARELGVHAPTKINKSDLIQDTLDLLENRAMPCAPSKRGKPVKNNVDIQELLTWLNNDSITELRQETILPPPLPQQDKENIFDDKDATGVLEVIPDGYGFLRMENYSNTMSDIYVPPQQIKRLSLRTGDKIFCKARLFKDKKSYSLIYVYTVNDIPCSELKHGVKFEDLVSCYPCEKITLEREKTDYSLRLIDLISPIGKGQRGLIVSPPKTGKTTLLKKIAQAVRANHPDIHLTVLLVDERPEEVTDFKQSVDCDVWYSTFDQGPEHHVKIAEMVIKNAKHRVEQGQDVMILMDSITRLGRAYNQTAEQSGRTLTGGLDISALQEPKRFFGAGRNVEGKGSLTILATALIDTNSKMDDIIYEEFKGTGNMEIHLDRRMSERRIFPAIDLNKSSTRREDLLLTQKQLEAMWMIRRALSRTDNIQATEQLIDLLMTTDNNEEFIDLLKVIAKKQK
ncbi:MAG TPA: transcription termination factor Rho [Clostridia bacterium]|nr:transcription termination factor Rho [Clostridia bacterium]